MDRDLLYARPVQLACGALLLSIAFGAWSLKRAIQIEPVPPGSPVFINTQSAVLAPDSTTPPDVVSVVAMNVFAPERTAPARRYRISGYGTEQQTVEAPHPVVLGTAVTTPERSFAMCRLGDQTRILRVGESIGGYTVRSIDRGVVVFTSASGDRLAIDAAK
jgi:hypothetical protein